MSGADLQETVSDAKQHASKPESVGGLVHVDCGFWLEAEEFDGIGLE
jgi:hypothetical protein